MGQRPHVWEYCSIEGYVAVTYDRGDMVIGAVIAPEVIVHLNAADMHVDYDSSLLVVQSSKALQYGDLVSRTKLFIMNVQQLCITSNSYANYSQQCGHYTILIAAKLQTQQ